MALTGPARVRLGEEGLTYIRDFVDFKEDDLNQAFKNMRTNIPPISGIAEVLNPDGSVLYEAIPPIPARQVVVLSAKCILRLKIASKAYHYYRSIDRAITTANMNFDMTLKEFNVEYEAIIKLSKVDKPEVPKITKNTTPLRWLESFKDALFRTFGVRDCPLLYVVREARDPPNETDDPIMQGKSFGESGSVLDEMIKRLSHEDPLFKSDNAAVYSMLDEATRGTVYAPTIKPYVRKKDGRTAYFAMVSSHIGEDKWDKLQKENLKYLMNTKWNGKVYSLEKFTGMHRSKFVQLEEAAVHVNFQLPTEYTRVGYLLDNIQSRDANLAAAMGSIRINTNGMRQNFERAVAFLLPVCPYARNQAELKENRQVPTVGATTLKNMSESKTGVDFRWYTKQEYVKLSPDQKAELYEWQHSKEGKAK